METTKTTDFFDLCKPNEVFNLSVLPRTQDMTNALEGNFINVKSPAHYVRIREVFKTLGLREDQIYNDSRRDALLTRSNTYAGVRDGVFGAHEPIEVTAKSYKIIEDYYTREGRGIQKGDFDERVYSTPYNRVCVVCQTPELAYKLGEVAKAFGYKWRDGTEYGTNEMYVGRIETLRYDISLGITVSDFSFKELSYREIKAQDLLYSMGFSLDNFETIKEEDLVSGKIYTVLRPSFESYGGETVRVPFIHNTSSPYSVIKRYGEYSELRNVINGYPVVKATDQEISELRALRRAEDRRRRIQKVRDFEELLKKRANINRKEIMKKDLLKHNQVVETQLLSHSLHTSLYKRVDDCRIARVLMKMNKLGHIKGVIRNLTISKDEGTLTYIPANRDTALGESGNWVKDGRQAGKFGKVIRKVLTEQVPQFKFTDQELEFITNHLKAEADNGDFDIVSGDKILHWYDGNRYADDEDTGTLGCSCMRHCPEFMAIYAENPNQCKMIILVKEGELHGRALLWNDKWMDRIYGSDSTIRAFKNFAKQKGYHSKSAQNSSNVNEWIHPETGHEYTEDIIINLDKYDGFDHYPYADTFYMINQTEGYITNDYDAARTAELRDTDGNLEGDNMVWDDVYERNIHEEDSVYLDYRNETTHVDNARYCDWTSEYYLTDDMVETENGDFVYNEANDLVCVEDGDIYCHVDDTFVCEHDNETYHDGYRQQVYLEELEITVMSENVTDAYKDAGYEYSDETGEWSLSKLETTKETTE